MQRSIESLIIKDLDKKMVFIGGPRQVGKTTLSRSIIDRRFKEKACYFNWDIQNDRRALLKQEWLDDLELVVFDELHKYPKWKQWIKGIYDGRPDHQRYLVTGSARLDVYKKGGDSLVGRYHYWRLHPITLDEQPKGLTPQQAFERLMRVGGFPEPFFDFDEREARRWRRERFDRILKEDIRDLNEVKNIQMLGLLVDALRHRAGSLLNYANIAADLEVAPKTVKSWLELCEKTYLCFSIRPYTSQVNRAILKSPKVYFFDNADIIGDDGTRFENLVATHLLKKLHFLEDYHGYRCALHYIRDKDGREVDFVTVVEGKIHDMIEVKWAKSDVSKSLRYYADKLKPKRAVQLVAGIKRPFNSHGVLVTSPEDFLVNRYMDTH